MTTQEINIINDYNDKKLGFLDAVFALMGLGHSRVEA